MTQDSPRTFIRIEYLKLQCVTVVLKQNNDVWACCLFDKKNNSYESVDFNDFNAAIDYAEKWITAKKNGESIVKWDTTIIKKKKK